MREAGVRRGAGAGAFLGGVNGSRYYREAMGS